MSDLLPGALVDGRYLVERILGRGGMAAVYRVRHRTLGSYHALKVLELDRPSVRERLVREGIVQARLRHPGIVAVSDAVEIDGKAALVMEYVHGPSLVTVIEAERLDLAQIDAVATQLFDGLEAAHLQGIVHRDLKPHNVILSVDERGVQAKIADFGLVKMLDEEGPGMTRSGAVFGTPEYMAPEQVRDAKAVDTRADLFALGVLLYELVSGISPFQADDLVTTLMRVSGGERAPLRDVAPAAPERMVAAVEAALVVDRDARVQTVAALRALWVADSRPSPPLWDRERLLSYVVPLPDVPTLAGTERDLPRSSVATVAQATNTFQLSPPAAELRILPPAAVSRLSTPEFFVSEPPRARSRLPWVILVVGTAGVTLTAGGILLAAAIQLWPAPTPELIPPVTPVPVAAPGPAPAPEPAPVAAPEPAPVAAPVAAPAPAPVAAPAPAPVAAPVPQVVPAPVPEPVAAPAPVPVPVGPRPRVTVTGAQDLTVVLRDAATGRHIPPADASVGRFEVIAFFQPNVPTVVRVVDLVPGSVISVKCSAGAQRCVVSP